MADSERLIGFGENCSIKKPQSIKMAVPIRFILLLCLLVRSTCFAQDGRVLPVVVLDPGHGGRDTGATGANGALEKNIGLLVAHEIVRLNRELYDHALEIYLTRNTDTLVSLYDRARLARVLDADGLVSLHCNHANRQEAKGIEVFVPKGKSKHTGRAKRIAELFANNLQQDLGYWNRGLKGANFQVLRETREHCWSVLIELGFLSNRNEAEHLVKEAATTSIALVILDTLIAYLNERNCK
ncbi:MAG: N-acetylmuramoyl-L-alanine amidase [Muricauda sp.]|nr:N-acetylmuramoyl-L-alanine amidase [Allomuricauda sp.]